LLAIPYKVIDAVIFLNADFGLVMIEGVKDPHQNRLCFPCLPAGRFVTFFAQAKKVK